MISLFLSLKSIIAIAVAVITFVFIYMKKNWIMSLFLKKVANTNTITHNDINLDTYVNTSTNMNVSTNVNTQLFAVNDNGNFDLADATGKILNIGFGPNPKIYINLLDQSEKDVEKTEHGFIRKMDTKVYEIGGKPYTVNFTQLT